MQIGLDCRLASLVIKQWTMNGLLRCLLKEVSNLRMCHWGRSGSICYARSKHDEGKKDEAFQHNHWYNRFSTSYTAVLKAPILEKPLITPLLILVQELESAGNVDRLFLAAMSSQSWSICPIRGKGRYSQVCVWNKWLLRHKLHWFHWQHWSGSLEYQGFSFCWDCWGKVASQDDCAHFLVSLVV